MSASILPQFPQDRLRVIHNNIYGLDTVRIETGTVVHGATRQRFACETLA